jgi:hypothetical protein
LSYLTPGLGWRADYVALYNESDSKIDVQGWVTLTNSSGVTYDNAQTLLVAGSPAQADGGRAAKLLSTDESQPDIGAGVARRAATASGWATSISIRWPSAPPSPICKPSR